ncbi:LOW QUALITY PROTEIN: protein wntless homolog [Paramacrobiotus metropolitanus]|uniref:LOW QUALITY PROTEIN: protein wntless homolog n=1 Tax=Paramacrobiotus metropolitanus TaxID=2943436 RepID=UPI00244615BD|nr:LOW QUALITY PROTEIN: protein wntless homolog [Paramacrobiotus metropolitanus]
MAAFIDSVTNRKLIYFGLFILLIQIGFFVIGGIIAPSPSNVSPMLSVKCLDDQKGPRDRWFYPRGKDRSKTCQQIHDFGEETVQKMKLNASNIVFAVQFPIPRDGQELTMSRWFQGLLGVLHPEIVYQGDDKTSFKLDIEIHARIGYRNKEDPEDAWKEIDRSVETRQLECSIEERHKDYLYNCTPVALFELGSSYHDFYLLNLRLPVHNSNGTLSGKNTGLGQLQDLWVVEIHQNGGFTRVWFSVKTVLFPFVFVAVCWFWTKIRNLPKAPRLLEKMLFTLGLAMLLLDLPLEFLSLLFDIPAILLISDIRQGIFYSILLAFWIIFAGEYQMDDVLRDSIFFYWKHLGAVGFGCICLFVFDMCERGVQLTNAFYSIWATPTGTNLAMAFIIVAGICACIYFVYLTVMISFALRNMWDKRKKLLQLDEKRRKHYQMMIFRFQFLLLISLLCAALTVISFIIGQVSESSWKWGDEERAGLEYTSAFFVGIFAMWNLYVITLLILYSPVSTHEALENPTENSEVIALNAVSGTSNDSILMTDFATSATSFLRKVAED